jgi:hypothetical protein
VGDNIAIGFRFESVTPVKELRPQIDVVLNDPVVYDGNAPGAVEMWM